MATGWRPHLILTLGLWGLLAALAWLPGLHLLEARSYDWLSTLAPPRPDTTPVVVVGIDEPSFAELGLQWPWPREVHAALIRQLHAAGAAVVALDVVFAEPSSAAADAALAAAIGEAGNVVLAADEALEESAYATQVVRVEPLPLLRAAGAQAGLATVALDGDGMLRRLPSRQDDFALLILQAWQRARGLPVTPSPDDGARLIQYFGPSRSYPYVSYYQALAPVQFLPEGLFRDRIVIVGRAVKTSPEPTARQADAFATPYTLSTGLLTAGAEIHATLVDNLRLGLAARPVPRALHLLLLLALTAAGVLACRHWQPLRSTARLAVLLLAVLAASYLLLRIGRLWLPPPLLLLGVVGGYLAEGAQALLRERAARARIKRAFAQYLAPELVEQLAAEPLQLKLGGEIRPMTVMFCDIRGFTTLAEHYQADPEGLTHVINRFFTAMTAVLMRHKGTVDKYIGDCIMAFWNAPLEEAEHARLACAAALAMVRELEQVNRTDDTSPAPWPALGMGIGLNTGPCVVGNMGSEQRFNYTVLGDAVNLASRLEGQTRYYGVPIIVGPETAAAVADMALLELDLIAVKGKRAAVRIYALLGDGTHAATPEFRQLADHHDRLLAAYRRGDWAAARAALAQCRARAPALAELHTLYARRIDEHERHPPPPGWDGVYVAEGK